MEVPSARPVTERPRRQGSALLPRQPARHARGPTTDATFAAMLVDWEEASPPEDPEGGRWLREDVQQLTADGMHLIVMTDGSPEAFGWLGAATGPGRLLACSSREGQIFELRAGRVCRVDLGTDLPEQAGGHDREGKAALARRACRWLETLGVTGSLIATFGAAVDTPQAGSSWLAVEELSRAVPIRPPNRARGRARSGPRTPLDELIEFLGEQIAERREARVPAIDADPAWTVELPSSRHAERVAEALGTLGNGWAATRASLEEDGLSSKPMFAVAGVYDNDERLLGGPVWTEIAPEQVPVGDGVRLLDLRTGVLARGRRGHGTHSLRFVSGALFYAMAQRVELAPDSRSPGGSQQTAQVRTSAPAVDSALGTGAPVICIATEDHRSELRGRLLVERLAAWSVHTDARVATRESADRVQALREKGFDALLAEHRRAWADRWRHAAVSIDGDPEAELATRFALFHLLTAAKDTDEAAIGARGLTGDAYAGHVFWDADVFVLPALTAIAPRAARAMLEYRVRRIGAARATASALGRSGARFPWESAASGREVSPNAAHDAHGRTVAIVTGLHEEHIVADVAWAAHHYASWTGDADFSNGPGNALIVETARYWSSRIRVQADGSGHIYGVMGPDEYHEVVDDNAFTNVMARWNLREGARRAERAGADAEASRFRALADALVDGYRPELGLYEQFAGYFGLEPTMVADISRPPVAIDVVLGRRRVAASQIIKQADVLMAHHLVPGELAEGSLARCLSFYEPRTAHGSSLSPAISAALFARAGDPDHALELFTIASRIDLDDLTRTTAGGVHLATMGGLWQALSTGFLGLRAQGDALVIDPRLPSRWSALTLRLTFRGRHLEVRAEHDNVAVRCDGRLPIVIGSRRRVIEAPGAVFARPVAKET